MLTSRELATVIIILVALAVVVAVPKFRAHMGPSLIALVQTAFVPRLVWLYFIVILVAAGSTALAWVIGLWDLSLLKDAVIIT